MFVSFTSSNLARAKTCPLTSDIIVCDCFHGNQCSLPLSVKPNLQVQSPNLCYCE